MFLLARQLHPHRALHGTRQQHRIGAHIVGAVAAIAASSLHADDFDAVFGALQQPGQVGAQQVRVLCAGPHADQPFSEIGQCAGGADRGMQLVRPQVTAAKALAGIGNAAIDITLVQHGALHTRVVADGLGDIAEVRQLGGKGLPADFQVMGGANGLFLALGHHADKVADDHHRDHAGHVGDGGFIDRQQAVADEVTAVVAGVGWADDPAVQHVGQAHVMHVGQLASGLAGDVHPSGTAPDQAVVLNGLERRIVGDVQLMVFALDQFGKAQCTAIAGDHRAFFNAQGFGGASKPLRGLLQQKTPRRGRRFAQRHGGNLQGSAGNGCALVRRPLGVAQHHVYLVHAQVQFFGNDLRQRGANAGAQVDVAVEGVDQAVVADGDEQRQFAFLDHGRHALGHGAGRRGDLVDDQQHAGLGQQLVAAGHLLRVVHALLRVWAARRTARRISTWVPQRHRLPRSSLRICSSLGFGMRSSKALAVMIMPFMQ